jgi:hypothetical protein
LMESSSSDRFAAGGADALSDLDLVVVASPGGLEEAWDERHRLAGDPLLIWEPHSNEGRQTRWLNWLTHDLVKVELGVAAPGSRDLAEPFKLVAGDPAVLESFPRVGREEVAARAKRRAEEQRVFDVIR